MILVVALVGMAALALVSALVVLATRKSGPPPRPSPPTQPSPPSKSRLPASCKITGDAFGANAAVRGGVVRQNVRATYHPYSSGGYATSTLACADAIWKWPDYRRRVMQYPWTAYCLDGTRGWSTDKCGRCLRVRNRDGGASVIVRVVDSGGCSGPAQTGLDLDPCAFDAIDTSTRGHRDGNLMVDVEEVAC